MNITIIGAGNMGLAMARGLKLAGFSVTLANRASQRLSDVLDEFDTQVIDQSYDISGKNIILAIKPNALEWFKSIAVGKANLILSVLARTSLEQIQTLNAKSYAISLPNIAAQNRASINPYMASGDIELASQILNGFGKAVRFNSKAEFDAASIISGCAPAYLAIIAEAITSAMTSGLFDSFNAMIKTAHPALIKDNICSPAGTTIEGVYELEKAGIRGAFMQAVNSSLIKQRG